MIFAELASISGRCLGFPPLEPDSAGNPVLDTVLRGENTARLFHSGQMFEGVWAKEHDGKWFRTLDQPTEPANFIVTHNGARVTGSLAISADRMAVRFTPNALLESSGVYTVVLKGGSALGPRDESGLRTLDNFVSSASGS